MPGYDIPSLPAGLPTPSLPAGTSATLPTGITTTLPTGLPTSLPTGLPTSLPAGLPTSLPAGISATLATSVASLTTGAFADASFKAYLTSNKVPVIPTQGSSSYDSLLKETGLTTLSTTDFTKYLDVKASSLQTLATAGLDKLFGSADYRQGSASSLTTNSLITAAMVLVGTEPNQKIVGGKANDVLICKAIDQVLNGGSGLNTAVMGDDKAKTQILKVGSSWTVKGPTSSATLTDVQRVTLSDANVALDVDGSAGNTAKVLGAILGKDNAKNKAFIGIGLDLLDKGTTYDELAGLALKAVGATTNDQIVTRLWTNVVGSAPSETDKAPLIQMLKDGMSPGVLARLAADTALNKTNINLVGLAETGIEFTPVA